MRVYLDASVLVSLLAYDAHTEKARRWFSNLRATVIVSDLATLETAAAFSRRFRTNRWTPDAVKQGFSDMDAFKVNCELRFHDPADFALAETFVRDVVTKLAAADALHLATAKAAGASLATFDVRLANAARAKGVEVTDIG